MYQIFVVSDATGTTAERVVQAALVQFESAEVTITRFGEVQTSQRVREIVVEAAEKGGFIVHTLVKAEMRDTMLTEGRNCNVATIDLMGPLLARLSELLERTPRSEPGGFQAFDAGYLRRMDAINFTVSHDDGRSIHDLDQAEIVLAGVSRTSKTPISIYLAYRGWKVANVPIALGLEPPPEIFLLPKRRVVGLIISPERLVEVRRARVERLGTRPQGYADLEYVKKEAVYAYEIFDRRPDWPLIDVTSKPVEEAATEVVSLIGRNPKQREISLE